GRRPRPDPARRRVAGAHAPGAARPQPGPRPGPGPAGLPHRPARADASLHPQPARPAADPGDAFRGRCGVHRPAVDLRGADRPRRGHPRLRRRHHRGHPGDDGGAPGARGAPRVRGPPRPALGAGAAGGPATRPGGQDHPDPRPRCAAPASRRGGLDARGGRLGAAAGRPLGGPGTRGARPVLTRRPGAARRRPPVRCRPRVGLCRGPPPQHRGPAGPVAGPAPPGQPGPRVHAAGPGRGPGHGGAGRHPAPVLEHLGRAPVSRPRLLVLSFSRIEGDARVLKQVRRLKEHFELVTCGYGSAPDPDVPHLQVPDEAVNRLDGRLITLRAYRAAYAAQAGVRWVLAHLPRGSADLVLANDLDAVPVALWLRPGLGVHADLHEFFPLLHEHDDAWMRRIAPYQDWLCRTFLPRAGAVTTVSQGLAREYTRRYGIEVGVVRNATPYADLGPTPAGPEGPRLVHSGACLRHRRLHLMIEAAGLLGTGVPFDLYLTPNDPAYLAELRDLAAGVPGVTVRDPVP